MKSPKVWSLRKELWSLRKVAGCWVYLALVGKGLKINSLSLYGSSLETQGWSVGPEEIVQWKFSSTGGKAPGYPLSLDHFQTVKRMLAPDWAQKCFVLLWPISKQHLLGLRGWIWFIIHLVNRCSMIVRVSFVQNRTVVDNNWHFNNLCGSNIQVQESKWVVSHYWWQRGIFGQISHAETLIYCMWILGFEGLIQSVNRNTSIT